jgi:superfamily II DNA/RNA helicase
VASGATPKDKRATLRALVRNQPDLTNAIVFCNRKRDIGTLFRSLERHGFSAGALHGDMDQRARMATLDAFKKEKITLLVASDVAARGLDIPKVSHVFNYDVPHNSEDYIHRIGRTGRAGRSGKAFTIATPDDSKLVANIERLLGQPVTWLDTEPAAAVAQPKAEAEGERKAKGRRKPARRGKDKAKEETTAQTTPAEAPAKADEPRAEAGEDRQDGPKEEAAPAKGKRKAEPAGKGERAGKAGTREPATKDEARAEGRKGRRGRNGESADEGRVAFKDTPYVPAFLRRPVTPRRTTQKSSAPAD